MSDCRYRQCEATTALLAARATACARWPCGTETTQHPTSLNGPTKTLTNLNG
jgi:hypothetical protein